MGTNLHFALCAFLTIASLMLGGATRHGFLGDALVQLAAIPVLLTSLSAYRSKPENKAALRASAVFCGAIAALPMLQLIPLPPAFWTRLPGHELAREAFEISNQNLAWMPLSVSPQATWQSLAGLLPPMALLFGVLTLDPDRRRKLSLVVGAVLMTGVVLGLLQVAQGEQSPLRFYEVTNRTEAVGFFANRNHFSCSLLVLMMIVAAWTTDRVHAMDGQGSSFKNNYIVLLVLSSCALIVIIAAQAMARSRAGMVLTIMAMGGVMALAAADRRNTMSINATKLFGLAMAAGIMFALQFALYRMLERFGADPLADARIQFARTTWTAVKAYFPFGSGLGTFVPVYASFEKTADALIGTYVNHAHDDFLELLLETGLPGLVIIIAISTWFVRRALKLWSTAPAPGHEIDVHLARAASIAIALIALHSFVDYPLRTTAMTATLAFCCGLVENSRVYSGLRHQVRPAHADSQPIREAAFGHPHAKPSTIHTVPNAQNRSRNFNTAETAQSQVATTDIAPPERTPVESTKWGATIEWPESWKQRPRKSNEQG